MAAPRRVLTCTLGAAWEPALLRIAEHPAAALRVEARCGEPANTRSAGSSPIAMVRVTRSVARSTTLTESLIWFTTHASPLPRTRTDTGSSPTGTEPRAVGTPPTRSNTSRRASGVFTATSVRPLGVTSTGWVCGDSQFTNDVPCESDGAVSSRAIRARERAMPHFATDLARRDRNVATRLKVSWPRALLGASKIGRAHV